jgi:hypothetical protein
MIYAVFVYVDHREEGMHDAKAYVRCRYRLRKGDTILLEKVVQSRHTAELIDWNYYGMLRLHRADFNSALIEALSLSLKDDIERMVQEVNGYCRRVK